MVGGWIADRKLASARTAAVALVLASFAALPSSALATGDSSSCSSPTATVADGFAGGTYLLLRAQQAGSDTLVCFRVDNGDSLQNGGLITIGAPATSVDAPDDDAAACRASGGDDAKVFAAPEEATVPVEIDQYRDGDSQWVCVTAGTVEKRLKLKLANPAPVSVDLDDPGAQTPTPREPDSSLPSSACHYGSEGAKQELANTNIAGTDLRIDAWQPSSSKVSLCVRADGLSSAGERIDIDATNLPSLDQLVAQDSDADACDQALVENDVPVAFNVSTSTTIPASVCVTVNGDTTRYFLKDPAVMGTPSMRVEADPSTPGETVPGGTVDQAVLAGKTAAGAAVAEVESLLIQALGEVQAARDAVTAATAPIVAQANAQMAALEALAAQLQKFAAGLPSQLSAAYSSSQAYSSSRSTVVCAVTGTARQGTPFTGTVPCAWAGAEGTNGDPKTPVTLAFGRFYCDSPWYLASGSAVTPGTLPRRGFTLWPPNYAVHTTSDGPAVMRGAWSLNGSHGYEYDHNPDAFGLLTFNAASQQACDPSFTFNGIVVLSTINGTDG